MHNYKSLADRVVDINGIGQINVIIETRAREQSLICKIYASTPNTIRQRRRDNDVQSHN